MNTQPQTRLPAAPSVRMAADFQCALAAETVWASRLASGAVFTELQLLAENFDRVTMRHRPQDLGSAGTAQASRLLRAYVEGEITAPLSTAVLRQLLPACMGGKLEGRSSTAARQIKPLASIIQPPGWQKDAVLETTADPLVSMAVARRFTGDETWQEYRGLKLAGLDFSVGAAAATLRARLIGARQDERPTTRRASNVFGPALALSPGSVSLAIKRAGAAVLTSQDAVLLTGLQLHLRREGMRPVFTVAAHSPHLIADGRLVVNGTVSVLANQAAVELAAVVTRFPSTRLHLQLRLDDGATTGVLIDLPVIRATSHHVRARGPAQPAQMFLAFEGVSMDTTTPQMRVAFLHKTPTAGSA